MKLKAVPVFASVSLLVSLPRTLFGAKWFVDGSVAKSGGGTSWGSAFKAIQEGIDAASDGDTVTVAKGKYHENIELKGKNIVLTSTDPLDRSVVADTVIDGDGLGRLWPSSEQKTRAAFWRASQ